MIGKTIGRYRIVSKLGEGGMGSVWKAEDPVLQRTIALKFLPESLANSSEARQRFLREARAASTLHHPGIATVHDAGESDGQAYIAMHLVEGETLAAKLARGLLPVDEALRVAIAVGEALAHAHEHGVLHRDVTTRNIMVDREGQVVVVDFGLALPEGHSKLTQTGAFMGTVAYVAPEVVQGGSADARSDVYSLSVVLYEMLAGRLPFASDRQEAVMYAAVNEEPAPPSSHRQGVPASCDRLVMKALSKNPGDRHQTAATLVEDLRVVHDSISPERAREPRSRARTVSIVLASLLLAAFATSLMLWRRATDRIVPEPELPKLAVLPLQDLSPDHAETRHIGPGIGATLSSKLAQVLGPRVIPWTTSQRYGGEEMTLAEIAGEMHVDALITGTYQVLDDRVLVNVSLVRAEDQLQSWAGDFEAPASDLLLLQTRIAVRAASEIKGRLTGAEKEMLGDEDTRNVEAYDLYLRGRDQLRAETPESFDVALKLFTQAVELDPEFALARVGIGAVHRTKAWYGWGGADNLKKAEASHRLANRLDPDLQTARGGLIRVYFDRGLQEECLKLGKEAAEHGKDDVDEYMTRAEAYIHGGLPEKAIPLLDKVLELDPASETAHWHLVLAKTWAGQWAEGIEAGEAYFARFGQHPLVAKMLACCYFAQGDHDQSRLYFDLILESGELVDADLYAGAAATYFATGDTESARGCLQRGIRLGEGILQESPDSPVWRAMLALLRAQLGERDRAMADLETVQRDAPDNGWALMLTSHAFASMGKVEKAIEMCERALRLGACPAVILWPPNNAAYLVGSNWVINSELRPRFERLMADYSAEKERLRALY